MQGISNCRLCISKVLHGGVHPRVLHFAMSETPSTRGHYQGGCGSLFFRAHYPRGQVPWSRLFIMSASTAVRAGKNASIRMQWGAAEIFQQRGEELLWSLFLTRENAKAFQRCHFRGTKKKKKKADSSILLAFHLLFCVGLDMPGAIHTIRSPLWYYISVLSQGTA